MRLGNGKKYLEIISLLTGNMDKMQQTTEHVDSIAKTEIIKECFRMEEAALFSSKGHFSASYFWSKSHLFIGIPMVVIAALVGTSIINDNKFFATIFSVLATILSAVMTFLNPNERASTFLQAGNSYDALLNDIRIFRTIDCRSSDNTELTLSEKIKQFSEQKNRLNRASPQIPWWAYQLAKKGILAGEGQFEIDKDNKSMKTIDQTPHKLKNNITDQPVNVEVK